MLRKLALTGSLAAHAAIVLIASRPLPRRLAPPLLASVEVTFVKPRASPPLAPRPAKKRAARLKPVAMQLAPRRPAAELSAPAPRREAEALATPAKSVPAGPIVLSGFRVSGIARGAGFIAGVGRAVSGPAPTGPASGPGGDGVAVAESVSDPPALLNRESIDLRKFYPPAALKSGFEGAVHLWLVIDSDGSILRAEVVGDPGEGLGEAALRAVREFRFSPGRVNGEPARAEVPFVIRFVIDS